MPAFSQNARASGNSYLHGHQRPPETPPCDTTLRPEGDGFEPSVPRERDCLTRLPRLTATAFPCGREGRTRLPHAPSGGLTQWRAANVRVIGLINERVTVLTISGKLPTASAANGLLAVSMFKLAKEHSLRCCQVNLSRAEKPEAGCVITLPRLHSAIR